LYRYDQGWEEAPTQKINETVEEIDYRSQLEGFSYLAIAVKQVKEEDEKPACPFECCVDMRQYQDKQCSGNRTCQDNQCILKSGKGEPGNKTGQGEGGEEGRGTFQESVIALMQYTATVILITILLYLGVSYYLKRASGGRGPGLYRDALPKEESPGGSAMLGKISDQEITAYFDLDQLKKHVMVSGATGSGKTVTAQVIAEEALEQGKNVIVLDPTAQWSGFLRENKTKGMLEKYPEFGMEAEEDVRSYNGNIRAVGSPEEDIDVRHLLQSEEDGEGEIVVFSLHKLEHKEIATFLNSIIEQVFDANMEEKEHLDTVIVFDEVHRLLEKFGGTEEGINQLEKGAREFRKWGVGMLMVSQVISDFPGQTRSNIGTKIQMRTRYKGDLQFYRTKYGIEAVRKIVKEGVGTGMIQNAEYNRGNPYFIDFRPLKHSPHRLTDEELDKYEEYNRKIDEIERRLEELGEEGRDVFYLRSTLSLARKNLRKGMFDLVDIYIEEVKDNLEDL
ncbi:MAG: helicase HerA-like domain-containing protein, partial [Candidatus Nanohaloarchaea archaeon]|nr:helicase HerA-like domain-containing protein [Candidatus Nanohaloarchaea archaeon]